MRAAALTVGGQLLLAAALLTACGKSVKETPHAAGPNAGAGQGAGGDTTTAGGTTGDGAGGTGDAVGGTSDGTGGSALGGSGAVGGGGAGRGSGGAGGSGGNSAAGGKGGSTVTGGTAGGAQGGEAASGGQASVCDDHAGFVEIAGELPGGFGSDTTLSAGCSDVMLGSYPRPASFTQPPGDTGGKTVRVIACSDDASLKIDLRLNFAPGSTTLQMGSLSYYVNGVLRGMNVTDLNETKKPVSDWTLVAPGSTDGVGQIYEGSFSATGSPTGTPVNVTGTFSVCHLANLP